MSHKEETEGLLGNPPRPRGLRETTGVDRNTPAMILRGDLLWHVAEYLGFPEAAHAVPRCCSAWCRDMTDRPWLDVPVNGRRVPALLSHILEVGPRAEHVRVQLWTDDEVVEACVMYTLSGWVRAFSSQIGRAHV